MEKTKKTIAAWTALCLLLAVSAFFLPGTIGTVLSCLAIGSAGVVGALCLHGFIRLLLSQGRAA